MNFALTVSWAIAATDNPFKTVAEPIVSLVNMVAGPLLAIVIALGAVYCIILGLKLAKAEEPQDREKAKGALKNAIMGFLLIFVLIAALNVIKTPMAKWMNDNAHTEIDINVPTPTSESK